MNHAHIEPDGRIRLPVALASFFKAGERIEVTQHRQHLALWRPWTQRRAQGPSSRGIQITLASNYEKAAQRYYHLSRELRARDVQTAMYLSGYAAECRLKRMICERFGSSSLERAEYEYARLHGYEPEFTGGHGHDLIVLAEAAQLWESISGDRVAHERFVQVNQWQVSWRYQLPDPARKLARDFFAALDGLWQWLDERSK